MRASEAAERAARAKEIINTQERAIEKSRDALARIEAEAIYTEAGGDQWIFDQIENEVQRGKFQRTIAWNQNLAYDVDRWLHRLIFLLLSPLGYTVTNEQDAPGNREHTRIKWGI